MTKPLPCDICSMKCPSPKFLNCTRWQEWAALQNRTESEEEYCPVCGAAFIEGSGRTNYCGNCGQRLQWEKGEEADDEQAMG
ncbi:MAG: hypothetical protein LBQ15_11035 [Clostridium sp.]|jgi:ribosomal protein S27AE|nr:hypothetical protein [Clostridium sp.]